VTQFKLEEMEGSGGEQTVEQRQQKLTGMIAEMHIDKVRQEYQQQQQKQQMEEQEQSRVQLAKQISAPAAPVKQPSPVPVRPVTGVVKPASAGFSYPKAPSEDPSNRSHSVSSPVHHPRVLPAVPIKQSSGLSGHVASSPAQAPVLSTSLPAVTSSHFVSSQPPPLQSFPWFHGDISRDIAVKRLEEYSMTDG